MPFKITKKSALIGTFALLSVLSISVSALAIDDISQTQKKVALANEFTYKVGDNVFNNVFGSLNIRDKPCGNKIGESNYGSTGIMMESLQNGVKMQCFNSNWTWLKINFGQINGFVAGEFLLPVKVTTSSPTSTKYRVNTKILPLQIRDKPCGSRIALAYSGSIGELADDKDNFVKANCNGGTFTWIKLKFGSVSGWAASEWTVKM